MSAISSGRVRAPLFERRRRQRPQQTDLPEHCRRVYLYSHCLCRPNVKELLAHEFFNEEQVPFRVEIGHKVSALLALPVPVDSLAPPSSTPGSAASSALPNVRLSIVFLDGRFVADGSSSAAAAGLARATTGDKGPFEFLFNYASDTPSSIAHEMVRTAFTLPLAARHSVCTLTLLTTICFK